MLYHISLTVRHYFRPDTGGGRFCMLIVLDPLFLNLQNFTKGTILLILIQLPIFKFVQFVNFLNWQISENW